MSGGEHYREEPILNVTVFVVRSGGGQYREELVLNIDAFIVSVWWRAMQRGSDTEYLCVCCEVLVEGNTERNWY